MRRGEATVRTFDELFADHRLTQEERTALVHHLAAMRYRKTLESLLPEPVQLIGGKRIDR